MTQPAYGFRLICLVMTAGLCAGSAFAETRMTVDSAVRRALEHNAELRAARTTIAAAEARTLKSGRLANPELDAELAAGKDTEGKVTVGITQRFPLTSRLTLERRVSAFEVEMAQCEVRVREQELARSVREAAIELAALRAAIDLSKARMRAAAEFAKSLKRGAAEGIGDAFDASKAELESDALQVSVDEIVAEEVVAAGKVSELLNLPAATSIALIDGLALPASLPTSRKLGDRADVKLAALSVAVGGAEVALSKASRLEDVGVGVFVEGERFSDEPEGIEPEALIGVRFSVPLPLWQNGKGLVQEQEALLAGREVQSTALRLQAQRQIDTAYRVMKTRFASARMIETRLLPKSRDQVVTAEAAVARGEATPATLFETQEKLADLESTALTVRKLYHLAHAEWLAAVGESFPATQSSQILQSPQRP